jgi:PPE-repeat protein
LVTNPHYAWLPPEINSALMFTGPGAGPLLAAAAEWSSLAEELSQSAASFWAVTSELVSGSWLGASSAAMMAVASQYAAWLRTAAAQAEGAAGQATAVAGEFEAALTAAVRPAVVAANRGLVRVLAATNWLGQTAPAIADVEAAYEQMWAMDVAAMSGYHANASALLAEVPSWDEVMKELDIGNVGNVGDIGHLGSANSGGFGLTGEHPVGTGLLDNGRIGFGHSGTGHTGLLNAGAVSPGVGNTGANNLGFWNAGFGQTGWMNNSTQHASSLLGFDNVTGASGALGQNLTSSGLLRPSPISTIIPGSAAASVGSHA